MSNGQAFRWIPEVMGQEGDKSYNLKVDEKRADRADGGDLTINLASTKAAAVVCAHDSPGHRIIKAPG